MPVKLSSMQNMRRTVTVHFEGDTCDVTYRVAVYTPAFTDRIGQEKTVSNIFVKQICQLVESWEVLDKDGKQLAPTPELVPTLAMEFLNAVLDSIRADVRFPNAQKNS